MDIIFGGVGLVFFVVIVIFLSLVEMCLGCFIVVLSEGWDGFMLFILVIVLVVIFFGFLNCSVCVSFWFLVVNFLGFL